MSTPYKLLAGLIILLSVFAGGFYVGKGQTRVEIQEKIVRVEGESKTVYKDKVVIVEKTVYPDGTVKETTKTEEKEGSKETRTTSDEKDRKTVTTPILSNYSLGLKYWASLDDKCTNREDNTTCGKLDMGKVKDKNSYEITAGRRIIGETWLTGGVRLDKQVSLGIALQF